MNKIKLLSLLILLITQNVFGQDFDMYRRTVDDNVKIPKIYENLLLEEYQILTRNIRMMDMAYAMIVPGYVHFKAKENKRGYQILSSRMLGYAGLVIYAKRRENQDRRLLDYISGKDKDVDFNDKVLFSTSLGLVVGSYLYDWIHGKFILEKKQENIKYKYGIKFKMEDNLSLNFNNPTPGIAITLNF